MSAPTPHQPPSPPRRREPAQHADPQVAAAIAEVVGAVGEPDADLLQEILTRAVQAASASQDRGELKILSSTLKDFTKSYQVFGPFRHRRKISIFGSARSPHDSPIYAMARDFARQAVARGYMVITGAGPGIMEAGNEGATPQDSFGVSIDLPFEAAANPVIADDPKLVHFKYFFTRKLAFVKETDAIALFPGGVGTMDELFEALTLLQTGKCDPLPVVMVDVPGSNYWPSWERYLREHLLDAGLISPADRNLFRVTSSIERALDEIERFYRTYHSLRYVGDLCILRLKQRPTPALLGTLNARYRDLLAEGDYELMEAPHPAERGEPDEIKNLARISFRFVKRGFGRLRRLIDELNLAELGPPAERPSRDLQASGGHLTDVYPKDA